MLVFPYDKTESDKEKKFNNQMMSKVIKFFKKSYIIKRHNVSIALVCVIAAYSHPNCRILRLNAY